MKKVLRQFRYYGEGSQKSSLNFPNNINKVGLKKGTIFLEEAELISAKIIGLKIQTVPGVEFYLNDGEDSLIIGANGVYELKIGEGYEISNQMRFTEKSIDLIDYNPNAYLIIDIIYSVEE